MSKVQPDPTIASLLVDGSPVQPDLDLLAGDEPTSPLDVGLQQPVTIAWSTIAVTSCFLDPDRRDNIDGVGINDTYKGFVPFRTADDSGRINLRCQPADPPRSGLQFSLKPVVLDSFSGPDGQTELTPQAGVVRITLSWVVQFASNVQLTDQGGNVLASYDVATAPDKVAGGSFDVNVGLQPMTYTLTCSGYGSPATAVVKVTPTPPITMRYDPTLGGGKGSVVVEWDITGLDFDQATGMVVMTFNQVHLCQQSFTFSRDPSGETKGQDAFAIPSATPPGQYDSVTIMSFTKGGATVTGLEVPFSYTVT